MPRGDGKGPMGAGAGGGKGQGQGRQRAGRMGGSAAGVSGFCVCPQCGEKEPHQRGIPCYQRTCPKCKTQMIRQ